MGYIRAEEILPVEVIELIQQYADGVNLYIPRKQENRRQFSISISRPEKLSKRKRVRKSFPQIASYYLQKALFKHAPVISY